MLQGGSSEEVMLGTVLGGAAFFRGQDFRIQEITALYVKLLRRPPTAAELTSFANGSLRVLAIRELLETGQEFFDNGI
jgi:hypothetical protein